jgi:hypothetical protein
MIAASDTTTIQDAGSSQLPKFQPITALAEAVTSMSSSIYLLLRATEWMILLCAACIKIQVEWKRIS